MVYHMWKKWGNGSSADAAAESGEVAARPRARVGIEAGEFAAEAGHEPRIIPAGSSVNGGPVVRQNSLTGAAAMCDHC